MFEQSPANFSGIIKKNEPMSKRTTMRVGGAAPFFIEPFDTESLFAAIEELNGSGQKFFVLGGGSNVILPDEINFPILSTRKLNQEKRVFLSGEGEIQLSAGALWSQVCNFCKANRIPSFKEFSGLPGTVGGAIFMNATCFGLTTSDRLLSLEYLDLDTMRVETYEKSPGASDWAYKTSPFQDGKKIILSAKFKVETDFSKSEEEMNTLYEGFLKERVAKKHFSAPSAGSVFKNDPERGIIAGKIIDECGLKGTQIGGAKIPEWHGNFIINTGNAKAKDIRNLVKLVRSEVKKKKNFDLKCEVLFIDI